MTSGSSAEAAALAAMADFDRAFAAGDARHLAELFAKDARLLLLHAAAIEGRPAILAHWTRLFDRFDTSAWKAEPLVVDEHGAAAYTVSTYSETLVPREPGPSHSVLGRLVLFWRRDASGNWLVALAMNSHVRPVEDV